MLGLWQYLSFCIFCIIWHFIYRDGEARWRVGVARVCPRAERVARRERLVAADIWKEFEEEFCGTEHLVVQVEKGRKRPTRVRDLHV